MLTSNSSHCHPADGIFDNNILLSHAICPSFCRYGLVTKKIASEIKRVCRLHHHLCSATSLDWLLSRNLKPQKLIMRAFSDFSRTIISTHENYPPYVWYLCSLSLLFSLVPLFYQNLYKLVIAAVANICFSAYIHVVAARVQRILLLQKLMLLYKHY